jgi:hypothetical protein
MTLPYLVTYEPVFVWLDIVGVVSLELSVNLLCNGCGGACGALLVHIP